MGFAQKMTLFLHNNWIVVLLAFLNTILLIFLLVTFVQLVPFFMNPGTDNVVTITPKPTSTITPTITNTPTNTPVPPTPTLSTTVKPEITRGNTSKKQLIFTFDGGSGTQSAQRILDVAASHNVKVTFFLTGKWAEQNPALVKAMSDGGHEIYNHTYSHPHLPTLSDAQIKEELNKTNNIIKNITGKNTTPFFRLPYGDHGSSSDQKRVAQDAADLGYQSVFWTLDALDWWSTDTPYNGQTVNDEFVKNRIYGGEKNGAIILMHIGDNITGNILDEVFTKVENEGYKLVTLSQGL